MIYGGEAGSGDLTDLSETVTRSIAYLKAHSRRFDFIAVSGMSGVIVGAPVAIALKKPLVIVRKAGDDHHGWEGAITGAKNAKGRYIFLDDFVSSGRTQRYVRDKLNESQVDPNVKYVGDFLYNGGKDFDFNCPTLEWEVDRQRTVSVNF